MRFFTAAFATLALVAAPILAAPSALKTIEKFDGDTTGKYIVKLKEGVARKELIKNLNLTSTADWKILNGFAGVFDTDALNTLRAHQDVEYIVEDGVMHTMVTQTDAPWGLQRISQLEKLTGNSSSDLTYIYNYDNPDGAGVNIYIVDTGINTEHVDFGGRATWGATFGGYGNSDKYGHGTHCAGTAAGTRYGVAKNANLIAVKVLGDFGSGDVSDIISGLDWVLTQSQTTGLPTVVSMSLGGLPSRAFDDAVTSLTSNGIHAAVAAGNEDNDASNNSPARVPSAITVGATTINDARASFSNYGSVVDIFAPGKDIISTWIGSTTATHSMSGTSMATPHVAGLIAYLISKDGNVSPGDMATKLTSLAVKGVLTDIPEGTPNLLAHNI